MSIGRVRVYGKREGLMPWGRCIQEEFGEESINQMEHKGGVENVCGG